MRVWVLTLDTDHYEQREIAVTGVFETLEKAKTVVLDTVTSNSKWRGDGWKQSAADDTGLELHEFYFDLIWHNGSNNVESIDKHWGLYIITEMDVQ